MDKQQSENLLTVIEKNIRNFSDKIAVKDMHKQYTYKQLRQKVQLLSENLQSYGLQKGERVGIFMENNADYIVCIMAILYSGGIFVPIACQYPLERVKYILSNCSPRIIITNSINENILERKKDYIIINIDRQMVLHGVAIENKILEDKDLVYIIYTSGSTGTPKGVAIQLISLENYIIDTHRRLNFDENSVSLNMTPFHFDGALTGVFCMLFCAGTLIISSSGLIRAKRFLELIRKEKITDLGCTPVQLSYLADALESDNVDEYTLKTLAIGGESFTSQNIRRIFERIKSLKILNRYGPTETTIVASSYEIKQEDLLNNKPFPIGKPISNTLFYAINAQNEEIREGEVGELYIGGVQLMNRYWEDAELTKNVINTKLIPGVRLYRTGDLVTIDGNGNYIFVSRTDDMVKINGYRVYLSEIDNLLAKISGITDVYSMILTLKDKEEIVSYVTCELNSQLTELFIKENMIKVLPIYMLPKKIFFIKNFPVTSNGKRDRKELEKLAHIQLEGKHPKSQ